jgi:hypothetical protein
MIVDFDFHLLGFHPPQGRRKKSGNHVNSLNMANFPWLASGK